MSDLDEEPQSLYTPFSTPKVEDLNAVLGDDFTVEEVIGKGGMAVVYRGVDHSAGDQPIALKLLPREIAAKDGGANSQFNFIERFEQEAQAMARLAHPNIVQVYKYGETSDGLKFFTMEYVEGSNLYAIFEHGQYSHDQVFSWLIQICEALDYAHGQGFVHRDIKPGNILISMEGVVKIADFGLVKVDGHESMHAMDTLIAMGTPDFSAPEIVDLKEKGDHRSDIYSVGILTYQLFTRMLPKGLWEPASQVVDGLDRRIDKIIDSALRSNRDKRYQSIGQMSADLKRIAPDTVTGLLSVIPLTDPEISSEQIRSRYFSELSTEDFTPLFDLASRRHIYTGETIMEKGDRNELLSFLVNGSLHVVGDEEEKIADLTPGAFIGEMSYLTGNRPTATVVATADCSYLAWDFSELRKLCETNEKVRAFMDSKISSDLVDKLTGGK